MSMDHDQSQNHNKKRIRVACDSCRKKKTKCDGRLPCTSCVTSKNPNCHYKEKPEKRRHANAEQTPKRISNRRTIEILDSRLSRLENVIIKLSDKLSDSREMNMYPEDKSFTVGNSPPSSNSYNADNFTSDSTDLEDVAEPRKHSSKANNANSIEVYFGSHSVLTIFSEKSLLWMQNILGPELSHLINPVRNLPVVLQSNMKPFVLKWVDPPVINEIQKKKLLEKPFPLNYQLVFDLLSNYFDTILVTRVAVDKNIVIQMFKDYYGPSNRKFKISELLIMSTAIALSIVFYNEKLGVAKCAGESADMDIPDTLKEASSDFLISLENEMLANSIYYYHRICVLRDGIETIQAIILLIILIDSSSLSSHMNFMLSTVAIRFAQEMGLHRGETYDGLDVLEIHRRKKVWAFCLYLDMEICFRGGKPPLINTSDISFNFGSRTSPLSNDPTLGKYQDILLLYDEMMEQSEEHYRTAIQYSHYLLILTKIRAKSYRSLFAASAEMESFETLSQTLLDLNGEMFKISDLFNNNACPKFCDDADFIGLPDNYDSEEQEAILSVQLTFFLHLMVINRIPFIVGSQLEQKDNEQTSEFRSLSLKSARTILKIAEQASNKRLLSIYNWNIFYPMAAFLNITAVCLNRPELPETFNDIKLLIHFSKSFSGDALFLNKVPKGVAESLKKVSFVSMAMRILLRTVVQYFELKTHISLLLDDPELEGHLNAPKLIYPEIFNNPAVFMKQFAAKSEYSTKDPIFRIRSTVSPFDEKNSPKNAVNFSYSSSNSGVPNVQEAEVHSSFIPNSTLCSFSPSFNPSLSNIVHPTDSTDATYHQASQNSQNNPLDDLTDAPLTDELSAMIFSQISDLPNVFFDNNLGI
ncbi:uncharacterized protein PRCAT00006014001 [Priceomyces carsonii]|uniref:uncharacterized protein n=1 Tax=Priceomyces carsonii TaxID=28549 RepID=UPI002EDA0EC3|nr:unnamed protein product [Priceomyces carsonii]